MFEHTEGVIRGCKSTEEVIRVNLKIKSTMTKRKNNKKTNNGPQNNMQKTKDCER
jgi:hypothetical protein